MVPEVELFGRNDVLDQIDAVFFPVQSTQGANLPSTLYPSRFVICGLGGVGKTQLAIQYMTSRLKKFDVVFWVQANTEQKIIRDLLEFANKLGIDKSDEPLGEEQIIERVKTWLIDPVGIDDDTHVSWLMVLDNADDAMIIERFWPANGKGCVLITTRDPLIGTFAYLEGPRIDLNPLQKSDAVALLKRRTGFTDSPEILHCAEVIVEELHCFPLGIIQSAGYISRHQMSLPRFLETWQSAKKNTTFYNMRYGALQGYQRTLASIIPYKTLSPGSLSLLHVLALLDSDCIPEIILTAEPQKGRLEGFPSSPTAYTDCLEELFKLSIVQRITDKQELMIHRVVQDITLAVMAESPDALINAFNASVRLICTVWPFTLLTRIEGYSIHRLDGVNAMATIEQCRELLLHIAYLWRVYDDFEESQQVSCATASFTCLLIEVAW
jgi:hypothetical protein